MARSPLPKTTRHKDSLKAATAGSGNLPKARGCDSEPGTPEWWPVFLWPGASVPTVAPHQKSRSESADQRLLLTLSLWSGIESRPDADTLLRARQAADRDLTRSPPEHRNNFAPAGLPRADRASARPPIPKRSAHNPDTNSAAPPSARPPKAWHIAHSDHAGADGLSNLWDSAGALR